MSDKINEGSYHSTLWYIHKNMIAKSDDRNDINGRKVLIEEGEIIEFRFHSQMNFRTLDNKYYCVDEKTWLEHCTKVGKIWDKVSFLNNAETKDIWKLRLFDEDKKGMNKYRLWKSKVSQ